MKFLTTALGAVNIKYHMIRIIFPGMIFEK
ncbi:hypothetical protein MSL71_28710 [Desulfoluna butyratoxydans]|uniref:Uncharacterized protein n=1 Tax=Desulfoluna butyratoxydans TaxID=231438 RepID=A0A4U8YNL5_9BACT|nr:hypothetical protein MSL71_28710 [Desulfoluna butyratoxydans]